MNNRTREEKRAILRRALLLAYATLLPLSLVVIIVFSKLVFNVGVLCPFYEIFGINCPGCGGTRMAVSLLHLQFYQAFRYNPLIFVSIPVIAVIFVWQSYLFIMKNLLIKWLDKFLIAYAIVLILFGIIRNIGIFSWLSPTVI